jgi:cytochrome P450
MTETESSKNGHAETDEGAVFGDNNWDPRDPAVLENQIRAYDEMRTECPVAHSDYLGWSVFGHENVVAVVTDHDTFSSAASSYPAVPNGFDPPKHGAYRRIIEHYFTPEHMLEFEPVCRLLARELVTQLPRDEQVEFIGDFALEYALEAQRVWLGWPLYTVDALRHWTARNHRATLARNREELDSVAEEFNNTVRRVLVDHRSRPETMSRAADDVTSQLLREQIDGVLLSDEEVVSILRNWTVGELGTMSASVGILVAYLGGHPDLQQELRCAPHQLPAAIDEILRMHSPLIANRRVAIRDIELCGRRISAGERVNVNWASANRDEAVFGDPEIFRPEENAADNLLYGRGIHDCPGAPLARLELRIVLEELLAWSNEIEIAGEYTSDYASYPASGFRTLPVLFS